VKHLKELPHLRSLKLGNPITDTDLVPLRQMDKLETLDLSFTDDGLVHLKGLTHLQTLNLSLNIRITAAGVAELQKALANCEISK
jgi:F-box/leucine-rich repeat protein 14